MTKEEKRDLNRKWREANPEYKRQYYQANREKVGESNRKWREANPEYKRQYYQANKEKVAESNRKWREANREHHLETVHQYKNNKLNHTVYLFELPDSRMYVGSTNFLSQRLSVHKKDSLRRPDRLLYKAIAQTGGWDQVKVHVLMHDIPDDKLRLKFEQHFINKIPEQLRLNNNNVVDSTRE